MKKIVFTFLFTLISTLSFADNGWYVTLHGYYYEYDYCIIYLWCPSEEYHHDIIDIYKNEQKLGCWKSKYEGQYVGNIGLKWPCTGQFEDWATYTLTVKSHIILSDGTKKTVYYKCNFLGDWFHTDQDVQLIYEGSETDNLDISEANFPDANFRAYLRSQTYGTDGVITTSEIDGITNIDVHEKGIKTLKGIEHLTELKHLYCYNNQITSIDVSANKALKTLSCSENQLTSLDVAENTLLETLETSNNQLTELNVSFNTALVTLECHDNQLTALDVSNCSALEKLNCSTNKISTLNLSKNTALKTLNCGRNKLTSLDLTNNTALTGVGCVSNNITQLNVSKNVELQALYCYNNDLTTLDVSNNVKLSNLRCGNNDLTTLDISNNTALKYLNCEANYLKQIDVSNNTALETFYCDINCLTHLDLSNNKALIDLACYHNQIKGEAMDALVNSLPTQDYAEFNVYYPTEGEHEGNICTKEQASIAKQKGWLVLYWNNGGWEEYSGSDASGINATGSSQIGVKQIYSLDGKRLDSMQKGLNIIKSGDGSIRKVMKK